MTKFVSEAEPAGLGKRPGRISEEICGRIVYASGTRVSPVARCHYGGWLTGAFVTMERGSCCGYAETRGHPTSGGWTLRSKANGCRGRPEAAIATVIEVERCSSSAPETTEVEDFVVGSQARNGWASVSTARFLRGALLFRVHRCRRGNTKMRKCARGPGTQVMRRSSFIGGENGQPHFDVYKK
ncbi:hypothetical protein EVAR_45464_1 [Eumeta japonica]|uniref:Uncharacterized protein n=1 Tax=Eumeta variegata TaxID=151549 RepID=A0A4C1WGH6_EUMVA|nr:hypothetical protein EVAR_45464_1 [Eumeta japonica]